MVSAKCALEIVISQVEAELTWLRNFRRRLDDIGSRHQLTERSVVTVDLVSPPTDSPPRTDELAVQPTDLPAIESAGIEPAASQDRPADLPPIESVGIELAAPDDFSRLSTADAAAISLNQHAPQQVGHLARNMVVRGLPVIGESVADKARRLAFTLSRTLARDGRFIKTGHGTWALREDIKICRQVE